MGEKKQQTEMQTQNHNERSKQENKLEVEIKTQSKAKLKPKAWQLFQAVTSESTTRISNQKLEEIHRFPDAQPLFWRSSDRQGQFKAISQSLGNKEHTVGSQKISNGTKIWDVESENRAWSDDKGSRRRMGGSQLPGTMGE